MDPKNYCVPPYTRVLEVCLTVSYQIKQELGKGTFSKVCHCVRTTCKGCLISSFPLTQNVSIVNNFEKLFTIDTFWGRGKELL